MIEAIVNVLWSKYALRKGNIYRLRTMAQGAWLSILQAHGPRSESVAYTLTIEGGPVEYRDETCPCPSEPLRPPISTMRSAGNHKKRWRSKSKRTPTPLGVSILTTLPGKSALEHIIQAGDLVNFYEQAINPPTIDGHVSTHRR